MEKIKLSEQAEKLKKGVYQHFKGTEKRYRLLGVAIHSETLEELVLYQALYGENQGQVFARPIFMWEEEVDRDGYKGPRFIYLGEEV